MTNEFTLFSLALKNVKRKPFRTCMLIAAIGLLVSAIVFALSFVRRVDSSIKITSERLGADLLIVPTESSGAAEDILLENKAKSFYMDKDIVERVRNIEGVDSLTYQTYLVSITGVCCDVPESIIVAFDQGTDFIIRPWLNKKIGRRLERGEAIVGSESAFNIRLGLTEVDTVLFGNIFKMVGVLDKTGTGLDTAIFIDDNNIADIFKKGKANIKPDQISVIFAKVRSGYDPYKIASQIEGSIIEVDAVARKDIGKSLIYTLRDINRAFTVTLSLASILSIFLVWAVFSAIANERAKEVGIMRAIGAKESHIVMIFCLEVFVIGSIGSILGIISGTAFSLLLTKSFTILKNLSNDLTVTERSFIDVLSFLLGTVICIFGALLPIQRIKKLEPLLAIKEE
ncbi:MAG: ABC transporter permease [Nitrospirae bacterium]|nr:ABC transporter permease [Nitrospirota bacterium]